MWRTFLKLHLAVLIAGGTGLFGRLISYDAFMLVYLRFTFAFALILVYVILTHKLVAFNLRSIFKNGFSGILLCIHLILFYLSIKTSNVSIGTITLAATSFFTALLEPRLTGVKFYPKDLIFSILIISGLLLIFSFDIKFRLGIVLGILSALFSSLFSIYNKRFSHHKDPYTCLTCQMGGGFVFLCAMTPLYALTVGFDGFNFNLKDFAYLLLLSSVFTVGLYLLVVQLMSRISAFTLNLTLNLEPVYAILLAILIFNEDRELNYSFYIGLFMVFLSVILQNLRMKKAA